MVSKISSILAKRIQENVKIEVTQSVFNSIQFFINICQISFVQFFDSSRIININLILIK